MFYRRIEPLTWRHNCRWLGDGARVGFPKHLDLTCAKLRALARNSVKIAHNIGNGIACNESNLNFGKSDKCGIRITEQDCTKLNNVDQHCMLESKLVNVFPNHFSLLAFLLSKVTLQFCEIFLLGYSDGYREYPMKLINELYTYFKI